MKYFFDNCISHRIAHSIRSLAANNPSDICHLTDRFAANTPDLTWIKALGAEGDWTVISGDTRIVKNGHELQAWKQAKLTGFFWAPPWQKAKLWDQAWRLVRRWPEIQKQAELVAPGGAFEVPIKQNSKFRQL